MGSYQAIYDATRSKISGGDVDDAIRSAIRDMNLTHYVEQAMAEYKEAAAEQMRPCVLLRPTLKIDGDKWCALYGENLQDGIAGFGKSPSDAMYDFDRNYHTNLCA
jgi:hypothetical protein